MSKPRPTNINYHKASHMLEVTFESGEIFNLPAEYLRVNSPSAEVQGHGPGQGTLQIGKQDVEIQQIDPVGNYAVCLHFDDNHNTGIYSWELFYNLGKNYEKYWQDYLDQLQAAGKVRPEPSFKKQ